MHPLLIDVARALLAGAQRVVAPAPEVASTLRRHGVEAEVADLHRLGEGHAHVLALLGDELSHAREHAESLVAEAARVLRPGGLLLASAIGAVWVAQRRGGQPGEGQVAPAAAPPRAFTAAGLVGALGHAGFAVEATYAPGAASRLAGAPPRFDLDADRLPGLLDASERVVAVARRHTTEHERSRSFFGSLPRKVVAAAVVCRNAAGDLLVVHDTYKQHWTIPGGVVDADEDPRSGATREAYEETGLAVMVTDLLGVFAASWPDRLVFLFAGDAEPGRAAPVHGHEIDRVAWMPLDEALTTLAPHVADQVRRSLSSPGGLWRQPAP